MSNKKWAAELSQSCGQAVKLPTKTHFEVSGPHGDVTLKLSKAAVCRNMQDDAAAFEGWALALLEWGNAGKITLSWGIPDERDDPHYQRFLYRVEKVCTAEPRVVVAPPHRVDAWSQAHGTKTKVLNVARGDDTRTPVPGTEAALEKEIATASTAAHQKLRQLLDVKVVDRQFPVGLFEDVVSRKTAIFPRGKSAIDLLVVEEDDTLCVVELKLNDNRKVGAVSELFFYTMVLQDLRAKTFQVNLTPGKRASVTPAVVQCASRIRGLLLMEGGGVTPAVHPLVVDRVLPLLSKLVGIDYQWKVLV